MLAIFKREVAKPPAELCSPTFRTPVKNNARFHERAINDFASANPSKAFSMGFGDEALLSYLPSADRSQQRLFCGVHDVYCLFMGNLMNLSSLNKRYGLAKSSNEAMFLIEAYTTLRDRGPLPAHQVVADLDGSFAFVIYDSKAGHVFVALGKDESVRMHWGIGEDGSVVICDDVDMIKRSCGKSCAPFPRGCMFHSLQGLSSYERPHSKMKPVPRVDSEGAMCGANFMADDQARVRMMPRVGSEVNWALSNAS